MRRFLRENGLALFFGVLFLATLVAQALVGWHDYNHDQLRHGGTAISLGRYLTSSSFATDVAENWQSEYLQFTLFILATIWLVQRGSTESKDPDSVGLESHEQQKMLEHTPPGGPRWARVGGVRTLLYQNSLLIVMTAIWLGSWLAQAIAGHVVYNGDQIDHHMPPVSFTRYLTTGDFWTRTFQNWQSEFLAVGSIVILSVFLRQRGSAQSKPVGSPHTETAVEG